MGLLRFLSEPTVVNETRESVKDEIFARINIETKFLICISDLVDGNDWPQILNLKLVN